MSTQLISPLVLEKRDEILRICARHGAGNVRVFGSRARGDARPDSDLDLLIDIVGPTTQWFPGGIVVELQDLLGINIDVTTKNGVPQLIRERIVSEAVPL